MHAARRPPAECCKRAWMVDNAARVMFHTPYLSNPTFLYRTHCDGWIWRSDHRNERTSLSHFPNLCAACGWRKSVYNPVCEQPKRMSERAARVPRPFNPFDIMSKSDGLIYVRMSDVCVKSRCICIIAFHSWKNSVTRSVDQSRPTHSKPYEYDILYAKNPL